jgi:hypothetical protein
MLSSSWSDSTTWCPVAAQALDDLWRHAQCVRRHQYDLHALETAQQLAQGMHGPPVAQVPDHRDTQLIDAAPAGGDFTAYGVQIEQGLAGMFIAAVAPVNHRDATGRRKLAHRSHLGMPHGDDIRVAAQHPGGVVQGFALGYRGIFKPGGFPNLATQQVEGTAKADACARAGLEEHRPEDRAVEHVRDAPALGIGCHSVGNGEYPFNIFPLKLGN